MTLRPPPKMPRERGHEAYLPHTPFPDKTDEQSETILGVVKAVSDKEGYLSLIDYEEYKRCRVVTCSLLTLPVNWKGDMPAIMDVVLANGRVEEEGEKLIFVANSLEKTEQ